jgi:hypothetical protein
MESTRNSAKSMPGVPPGYTLCRDVDGSSFAVPQFLVPAAHSAFDTFRGKKELDNKDIPEVCIYPILLL